jgi:plastocyanin
MRSHARRVGIIAVVVSGVLWGAAGVASAGGGGCHDAPTAARGNTVELANLCFTATVLYVEPGTDVTWTNRESMSHDVVGVGGSWGDPTFTLFQGDQVTYGFADDGVYPYACLIHPGMVGAVVVGDGVGTSVAGVTSVAAGDVGEQGTTGTAPAGLGVDGGIDAAIIWIVGAALILGGLAGASVVAARARGKEEPVVG